MHLQLCTTLYPRDRRLQRHRRSVCHWFTPSTLTRLVQFRRLTRFLDDPAHLILLKVLNDLGVHTVVDGMRDEIQAIRGRFAASVAQVHRLDSATYYWWFAHALARYGVSVDTRPLNLLARKLPRVSSRTDPFEKTFRDAFNYATHLVLFETRYLHKTRPDLSNDRCVQWLIDFWDRTDMRSDVEFLSVFLACLFATRRQLSRAEVVGAVSTILDQQSWRGCWQGGNGDSRYDRFHAAWCATDVLHLSNRLL